MKNTIRNFIRFILNLKILKLFNYLIIDFVYTEARRILFRKPYWRYGTERIHEVSQEIYQNIKDITNVGGKNYMELGCGKHHPFGISAVMFVNGAVSGLTFDIQDYEPQRAAEALYDLLTECAAIPSRWHFSEISREQFYNNIYKFDLLALKKGDLSAGLKNIAIKSYVESIYTNTVSDTCCDLMSSRSVMEHFMDFDKAVKEIYRIMIPGGIGFHYIDMVDHRAYFNKKYSYWSFLSEPEGWSDKNMCNRLRLSEIKAIFEQNGFRILKFEPRNNTFPESFRKKLKGRFAGMSSEELSATGVSVVIQK